MSKPISVLISDIHYNLQNLKLADAAMRMAIDKANVLSVPLIVAGDLHDTKANLRGECVNAMLETFSKIDGAYIIVGNHCRLNEKAEAHSLNFLVRQDDWHNTVVIDKPQFTNAIACNGMSVHLIPYHHDTNELRAYLKTVDKGSTLIMHQGVQGSNMGDYFQDKSAINTEDVAGFRVISGHYHARQTIILPDGGKWDYIGSPYTMSYGEANDPPKGFQILMSDGSLEFVPTNLRKHVKFELDSTWLTKASLIPPSTFAGPDDLLWVRIHDTHEKLSLVTRAGVAVALGLTNRPFKLDLIPLDTKSDKETAPKVVGVTLFDSLIDSLTNTSDERKERLKELYKHLGS